MAGNDRHDDDGIVLRPVPAVVADSAIVPAENLVEPPTEFTHEVTGDGSYWFDAIGSDAPAGTLPAGTPVVLVARDVAVDGAERCRVVDGRGLAVVVACRALRPLP